MLETAVLITVIVCATTLVAYLARLSFMSKCTDCDLCCIKVHREIHHEDKNVSMPKLPLHI